VHTTWPTIDMVDPIEETVSGLAAGLLISSGLAAASGFAVNTGRASGGSTGKRCGGAPAVKKLGGPAPAAL
jgi:hypothetical protein